jgi:alkaline phosphatase
MGGGLANFLPKSAAGSRRNDEVDFVARFRDAGYPVALTADAMKAAAAADTTKLLGLFNTGNMDGVLDRKFLRGGTVAEFPNQPDLTEQVSAALQVLSRNDAGFVLMVESGLIDKYTHVLDMERAVYDTIMLDNAVRIARDWASGHGDDTLILVVADHNHPVGLIGTIKDDMTKDPLPMRERVQVYYRAEFPNYPAPDAEGYPSRVDVSRRLALFSAGVPDYYETGRPKLDGPNVPAVPGQTSGTYVANDKYKDAPGAVLRPGNLPVTLNSDVHSGEDVILTATGPGSERIHGQMDNTEVFRVMVEALGLSQPAADFKPDRAALP